MTREIFQISTAFRAKLLFFVYISEGQIAKCNMKLQDLFLACQFVGLEIKQIQSCDVTVILDLHAVEQNDAQILHNFLIP